MARHTCCIGPTWYTELSVADMEKTLNCNVKKDSIVFPMKRGDVLLFSNTIPHRRLVLSFSAKVYKLAKERSGLRISTVWLNTAEFWALSLVYYWRV